MIMIMDVVPDATPVDDVFEDSFVKHAIERSACSETTKVGCDELSCIWRDMPEGLDRLNPEDGIALFTDGSAWAKDGSGGWAWLAIGLGDGEAFDSGGASGTTNNRMEMLAWIEGLNALFDAFGAIEVLVYSDSEYVGLGISKRYRNRKKNHDLWHRLEEAFDQHEYVKFMHVKGHETDAPGHQYNHRVDRLAHKARINHREANTQ